MDNGFAALNREENRRLYQDSGLAAAKKALKPGGNPAVWSAGPDDVFQDRLRRRGFLIEVRRVPAPMAGDPLHAIYPARKPA